MTPISVTHMSLRTTLPLSDQKTRQPASNITLMNVQHDLNTQRIGMASRDPDNHLLAVKTLAMPVQDAIAEMAHVLKRQDDILDKRKLSSNLSANLNDTSLIAKTTITLHTNDLALSEKQSDLAQQILPVLNVMFTNRMPTTAIAHDPVAQVDHPNATTTAITVDKPSDIKRPAAYLAALLETKDDCERTQAVLDVHGGQPDLPLQLFNSAKERIVSIIPQDGNALFALEALSHQSVKATSQALVA